MNKDELTAALKELGVEAPEGATNKDLEALLKQAKANGEPPVEEKTITVICAVASLYENGERYSKGDELKVTAARAEALGKSVSR